MILREMVTTYGRSPGGYIWAVLEPVAAIFLLSIAFSLAFRAPSLGFSFPLFYATGYLPYMLFHDVSNKISACIRFSRPLLEYPKVSFVDAILGRFILNLLTHLMVFLVIISGILIVSETRVSLDLARVSSSLLMASSLAIGVGTLNCYLFLAFPAWERIWQIVTRPLFIVSGIFFTYEDVPGNFQDILWYNPLLHITGEMRGGFYGSYQAEYVNRPFVYAIAALSLLLGILILRREYRQILNK